MKSKVLMIFAILSVIGGSVISGLPQQTKQSTEMKAAIKLVSAKKWFEAGNALTKVVKSEPKNGRAWFLLGFARHAQGNFAKAIEAFKTNYQISKSPFTMYNIAAGYSRLNKPKESFEWLEKALNTGGVAGTSVGTDIDFINIKSDPRFKKMLTLADKKKNPCMYSSKSRDFDFWIGDWEVFVRGVKVGENLVKLDTQGCTLVENWRNNGGGLGKSLNVYNGAKKKWQQFYVGGQGGVFEFTGEYNADKKIMHFTAESVGPKGGKIMHIFEFHDLPDKTVRQWWQQSNDGGKTWNSVWDSIYKKRK